MQEQQPSQTIDIRLAKPRDGDRIAHLSKRLIEAGLPWWCWTPKRIAKSLRSPDTVGILAVQGKSIVGFAVMYFGDETAHLNLFAVEPKYRRLGIGKRMLAWLEESCSIAGIRSISLEVRANNRGAIRFYQSLQFISGDRIANYYCGVEAALRMSKDLTKASLP